jgi:hypothetical protein
MGVNTVIPMTAMVIGSSNMIPCRKPGLIFREVREAASSGIVMGILNLDAFMWCRLP